MGHPTAPVRVALACLLEAVRVLRLTILAPSSGAWPVSWSSFLLLLSLCTDEGANAAPQSATALKKVEGLCHPWCHLGTQSSWLMS